jgi:nicotinamide mononucleotide adenylyltransferase
MADDSSVILLDPRTKLAVQEQIERTLRKYALVATAVLGLIFGVLWSSIKTSTETIAKDETIKAVDTTLKSLNTDIKSQMVQFEDIKKHHYSWDEELRKQLEQLLTKTQKSSDLVTELQNSSVQSKEQVSATQRELQSKIRDLESKATALNSQVADAIKETEQLSTIAENALSKIATQSLDGPQVVAGLREYSREMFGRLSAQVNKAIKETLRTPRVVDSGRISLSFKARSVSSDSIKLTRALASNQRFLATLRLQPLQPKAGNTVCINYETMPGSSTIEITAREIEGKPLTATGTVDWIVVEDRDDQQPESP